MKEKKIQISKYNLKYFSISLISLLLGFFMANFLSTMPGQTGDSSIIAASIIVTLNEVISKSVYRQPNKDRAIIWITKYTKIGIIYGLFVEAFKLGS